MHDAPTTAAGSIERLARFPVKSMLGQSLSNATFDTTGMLGDRAYAVVARSDGSVASAKNPRRWGALLSCRAELVDEPVAGQPLPAVVITLPDGSAVRSDDDGRDSRLSRALGEEVTLSSQREEGATLEEVWPDVEGLAPEDFIASTTVGQQDGEPMSAITVAMAAAPGTFFDLAPVHLLTTSTLRALRLAAPDATFDWRRYRPNVIVASEGDGFVENTWAGRRIVLGGPGGVVLSGLLPTMRCVMTTLPQDGLPLDRGTLQAIARANRIDIPGLGSWACAGLYAGIDAPGKVAIGDPVVVHTSAPS